MQGEQQFFSKPCDERAASIQGLILLYDAADGRPLAVMESGGITIKRTGAATAVAAKHLARPDARIATLVGAGLQAAIQVTDDRPAFDLLSFAAGGAP